MTDMKILKTLELDKILNIVSGYAVLEKTKYNLENFLPLSDCVTINNLLDKTAEAYKLLYDYNIGGIEFFDDFSDELDRAEKGATLGLSELLRVARLLKSSRIVSNNILAVNDDTIVLLPEIVSRLYCDQHLEKEIFSKIVSDERVSDNASEKLYSIRKKIKKLNEQIREKLNWYIRNGDKFLQENIVTIRSDRYVIPVKSEFRSEVKGFIHDQSASGATVFVEPVEVLEMNNQLRIASSEEALEIQEIMYELSQKIGVISHELSYNIDNVCELDEAFSKAVYAYKTNSIRPIVDNNKLIEIYGGRHPLIDKRKVVPLTVKLGEDFNYLLITGPNTGGKTVTLKLTGLFVLMASSGIFLPCFEGTRISVFADVYCDIGDEQSIEHSLSTFSSHIKNIVHITENANSDSLVLIDEIGAGTDPDQGSALAQAVIEYLLSFKSRGIITTHYSRLKEFAFCDARIKNASMEFDPKTFEPLYKLNIGAPGSSNAIEISSRLGLSEIITVNATSLLSNQKIDFENVLKEAEKVRQESVLELEKYKALTEKTEQEYKDVQMRNHSLQLERERLQIQAKSISRSIINEKTQEAQELVNEIKAILEKEEISGADLIKARTLKNILEDKKYSFDSQESVPFDSVPFDVESAVAGQKVYISSLSAPGEIIDVDLKKKKVKVLVNGFKYTLNQNDICALAGTKNQLAIRTKGVEEVRVSRSISNAFKNEINVIGFDRIEAVEAVEDFIDRAVLSNSLTVTVVHGVGMRVLSTAIHSLLKKHPSVKEYRFGRYGEGENGVTVITLK